MKIWVVTLHDLRYGTSSFEGLFFKESDARALAEKLEAVMCQTAICSLREVK